MSDIETKQEIEALVKQLSSRNIAEREAAEAAIRRLGPAAVQDLLAILAQEKIKRAQKRRGIGIAIACYFVFMITCIILTHNPALLASLGSMSGLMVAAFAATQTQRDVALVLTQLEDLRTVGALAEALEYLDQKLCSLAENALITLL